MHREPSRQLHKVEPLLPSAEALVQQGLVRIGRTKITTNPKEDCQLESGHLVIVGSRRRVTGSRPAPVQDAVPAAGTLAFRRRLLGRIVACAPVVRDLLT